jgi:hypothetical protein
MNRVYLYRHIRLDTNMPFYIGIGSHRIKGNKYERAYSKNIRNKIWERIVEKAQYRVEIMLDDMVREDACVKEKEFISLYGRIDLKLGTLANLTDGGDGIFNISEDGRRRISDAAKIHSKGRYCSQSTREKLRASHVGIPLTDSHRSACVKSLEKTWRGNMVPIERIDLVTCEVLQSYSSINEAVLAGYSGTNISELINHKRNLKSHKGFGWRKTGDLQSQVQLNQRNE